jgi:hypothetical protein
LGDQDKRRPLPIQSAHVLQVRHQVISKTSLAWYSYVIFTSWVQHCSQRMFMQIITEQRFFWFFVDLRSGGDQILYSDDLLANKFYSEPK